MKLAILRIAWPMLLLSGTVAIHAAQFGDFTYESTGTEITITEYTGPGGDVTIPETIEGLPVTSIGGSVRYGPGNIVVVTGAFSYCTGLTSVVIPDSVTSIGARAFKACTSLADIRLPNNLTNLQWEAFSGCVSLGSVTIPNSVTNLDGGAFSFCASLTNVTIGNGVTSIGSDAFIGCTGLTAIDVDPSNPVYSSLQGVLFDKSRTTLLAFPKGKAGAYAVPDGVTSIESDAFIYCTGLTSITIPNSVTSIGSGAFAGCSSLASVTIPNSVTSIGSFAFSGCTSLTGAYFGGLPPALESLHLGYYCPVIVFYRPGTAGWGLTFGGHPTALWIDPPVYSDWLPSSGLLTQYPDASAEADDPDQDGLSNYAEMLAGTDPTDPASVLTLEKVPRPADLTEADRTPLAANQHAIYCRCVPGKQYGVQWAETVDGPWNTTAVVSASTTQTRFVFDKPASQAFYRVILAQ